MISVVCKGEIFTDSNMYMVVVWPLFSGSSAEKTLLGYIGSKMRHVLCN